MATVTASVLAALGSRLRGAAIVPGDRSYDVARRVWNGAIDRHPSCIIACADAEDVSHAVRIAADNGLSMTARGGGHNVAGRSIRALYAEAARDALPGAMTNFSDQDDADEERWFGSQNAGRLQALRRQYDPTGIFRGVEKF